MNDFVHLHVHSFYSMMQGVSSPEVLCMEAKKAGFTHLAMTDTYTQTRRRTSAR